MRCFHEIFGKNAWERIPVISTPHCGFYDFFVQCFKSSRANFCEAILLNKTFTVLISRKNSNHFAKILRDKNSSISILWCGNYGNSLSGIFGKNFVKVTVLLNKLLKSWFDEIFFRWERISRFSTLWCSSQYGNWRIFVSQNFAKLF